MKGIWIPSEILDLEGLTPVEMMILAVYRYYTVEGSSRCCFLSKERVAEMVHTSTSTVQRAKKRFVNMGWIRTDRGIRVYYTGVNHPDTEPSGVVQFDLEGVQNDLERGAGCTSVDMQDEPHNKKEKKEDKEKDISTYSYSCEAEECNGVCQGMKDTHVSFVGGTPDGNRAYTPNPIEEYATRGGWGENSLEDLKSVLERDIADGVFESELQLRERIKVTEQLWEWEDYYIKLFHFMRGYNMTTDTLTSTDEEYDGGDHEEQE